MDETNTLCEAVAAWVKRNICILIVEEIHRDKDPDIGRTLSLPGTGERI